MENISVSLVFQRRQPVGRKSWNPASVEISFPFADKPNMLPDEDDVQLYVSGYINQELRQVRFDFSLTPRDIPESLAGLGLVDTFVGAREVWIQIHNIDRILPEGWIARPRKFTTGVLEDKDSSFTVTFSLD